MANAELEELVAKGCEVLAARAKRLHKPFREILQCRLRVAQDRKLDAETRLAALRGAQMAVKTYDDLAPRDEDYLLVCLQPAA
jgi:hypothetical protein